MNRSILNTHAWFDTLIRLPGQPELELCRENAETSILLVGALLILTVFLYQGKMT